MAIEKLKQGNIIKRDLDGVGAMFSRVRLCDPVDCSPPGSSVPGTLQARTLEGAATPSSRGPSRPGD